MSYTPAGIRMRQRGSHGGSRARVYRTQDVSVTDNGPIVIAEEAVLFDDDFADTILEIVEPLQPILIVPTRATTASEWPPSPPPPAALDPVLAIGTRRPVRRAQVFAAVRRPTTSGDRT
jgi:hypothetical protein